MKKDQIQIPSRFSALKEQFPNIYVIVSPPRCSSTAFSRVFWEQPSVGYYSHEPFEVTYYRDETLETVAEKLEEPLDLQTIKMRTENEDGHDLVVKEMPYQVGANFPILAALATEPVVFLLRDPRLNIASRIEKKLEGGDNPSYPFIESGWDLLATQVEHCESNSIDHLLVDSGDFRNEPDAVFPQIFSAFGLPFSSSTLSWRICTDVEIDNLDGAHRHLYRRVLESDGIQPATEPVPPIESFPGEGGWRDHVAHSLEIYNRLLESENRISTRIN